MAAGRTEHWQALMQWGAAVNPVAPDGSTLLHLMTQRRPFNSSDMLRRLDVLRSMIALGADINVRDLEGRTPLACAMRRREWALSHFMLGLGADISLVVADP